MLNSAPWAGTREELEAELTTRELDAVHSHASAAVRIGARAALAEALSLDVSRLQIVCAPGATGRRPPLVLLDDAPGASDLEASKAKVQSGLARLWEILQEDAERRVQAD